MASRPGQHCATLTGMKPKYKRLSSLVLVKAVNTDCVSLIGALFPCSVPPLSGQGSIDKAN